MEKQLCPDRIDRYFIS